MQARIHQYMTNQFPPHEFARTARHMLAEIGLIPGFVSYVMLDAGHGRVTSVCICEEPVALDAVDAVAATWTVEHGLTESSPDVTTGDIVLQRGL